MRSYAIRRGTSRSGELIFDDDNGVVYINDEDVDPTGSVAAARAALLALLSALPTADQTDSVTVYNDSGVLKVSTAG